MNRPYVLIAEDDAVLREIWRITVGRWGWLGTSTIVGDGWTALTEISREMPDVLITDLHMPVMSGECLLKILAKVELYHRLPIVIVSSDADSIGTWPNVVAVFTKPAPMKAIEETVRNRLVTAG